MNFADVWIPSFKAAFHYIHLQDTGHSQQDTGHSQHETVRKSALDIILKRIIGWNYNIHGPVNHHIIIKIPSDLLSTTSGRSAFLIMNQLIIKKKLVFKVNKRKSFICTLQYILPSIQAEMCCI